MNCQVKQFAVIISSAAVLVLSGCSVSPKNPASPYYTSVVKTNSHQQDKRSSRYVTSKGSPIGHLKGSMESRLWQHFAKWRGTPYTYGGASKSGVDCSAYVQITMDEVANLRLPRTTQTQIHVGKRVARAQLKAGDVVFFQTGANQLHNGIYMGDGKFMHASTSSGVILSEMRNVYWQPRYLTSNRVL